MLNDPIIGPHFALLQIHIGDGYTTTWGNQRDTFYNVTGTPTAWFDGITSLVGASSYSQALSAYTAKYNQRRSVATNVSITMTAVQQSSSTYTIRARVCVEPGLTRNLRLYTAAVLDNYPIPPSYSRWCFRQAASVQDVTLAAGQCYLLTRTITFDSTSWNQPQNIRVVVWAQAPNASGPAEAYNSQALSWPFGPDCNVNGIPDAQETDCNANDVPDECDIAGGTSTDCDGNTVPDECDLAGGAPDCNSNGILDSCDIAGGSSPDANGNGIPDECETLKGDLNCDSTVDFGDINPFILALSNPIEYANMFPTCDIMNADVSNDGAVDFQDINPFIDLLIP